MNTLRQDIKYHIAFDTRTGVTVPQEARATILAAARLDPALSPFDSWTEELLAPAHDSYSVQVGVHGSTTLRSFQSPGVTASQIAMLESFIQHGAEGQNAVLWASSAYGLRLWLFECKGTGTAIRHEPATVFPTYTGLTRIPATPDADSPLMELRDALHVRRTAWSASTPSRRTSRLDRQAEIQTGNDTPQAVAAVGREI